MVCIIIKVITLLNVKILLNLLCTPLNLNNPSFISLLDIPTVIATAAAATEFLTLCIPNNGILIFLIFCFFLFGKFIIKSNSVNSFFELYF